MNSWSRSAGSGLRRRRRGLFAVLVIAGCASGAPPAPAPVSPAPPTFGEPEIVAVAELLRFEDERRADTQAIGAHLGHPHPEVRRRAALALGRIGDQAGSALLLRALNDTAISVRRDAAFALGELGDTSGIVLEALTSVIRADEPEVAAEAVAALGKLPAPPSLDAVRSVLGEAVADAGYPAAVTAEALLAVWHLPRPERALEDVAALLATPDAELRWRAAYAVMRIGTPASVRLLLPLASDSVPLVRALAVRGLRRPIADSAGSSTAARDALLGMLGDVHPHVRINALNALATFADSALSRPLASMLGDGDANVAVAAAQALSQLRGGGPALALLMTTADTAAAAGVRAAALNSLVQVDAQLGARVAEEWVRSERWLFRWFAVRAVSGLRWRASEPVLTRAARDAHVLVASSAISAASRAPDTPATGRALFIEGMRRNEVAVRAAAIRGLARAAGPADLAALLDAYGRAVQDTGNAAALAAVDGLGAIRDAGVPVENAFFARFEPPPDAAVRRRVTQRLGGSWPQLETPAPGPKPDSFYLDAVRRLVAPVLRGEAAPQLAIRVREGEILVELAPEDAPLTVSNMIDLVDSGFYAADADADRRRWHRVVPNFVLQDGDPRGDGGGGPGYAIRDEINRRRYERGVLGMALSGPDTGGSQFFITHSPQPHLDGGYTVFGRVIRGMDIADRVVQDEPILEMRIIWPR